MEKALLRYSVGDLDMGKEHDECYTKYDDFKVSRQRCPRVADGTSGWRLNFTSTQGT